MSKRVRDVNELTEITLILLMKKVIVDVTHVVNAARENIQQRSGLVFLRLLGS